MQQHLINFETFGAQTVVSKHAMRLLAEAIEEKAQERGVDPAVIRGAELTVNPMINWLAGELAVRLSQTFATSDPIEETNRFFVPATWWDHWKQDHAPNWFRRWFPVQMNTLTVNYTKFEMICPHTHRADFAEEPTGDCLRVLVDINKVFRS